MTNLYKKKKKKNKNSSLVSATLKTEYAMKFFYLNKAGEAAER